MSLMCPVGPETNLLEVTSEHCARMVVDHPILTLQEMQTLKDSTYRDWKTVTIDCTVDVSEGSEGMVERMISICEEAAEAVQGSFGEKGVQTVVLSDRMAGPDRIPIPSLLAVGAVHQHLLKTKQRPRAALFVESGDAREVHDFATLLGFGADGVSPYLAYEALARMNHDGIIKLRSNLEFTNDELFYAYRKAAAKGILKVMSKMGISTLQSYKGAQVFEALGLDEDVMDRCFTGTLSRIKGADFGALYADVAQLHREAYPQITDTIPHMRNPGNQIIYNCRMNNLNFLFVLL